MTFDQYTLKVLSNFSGINSGLVVSTGNELRTILDSKELLAEAIVPVNFPIDFAISDLRSFLGCLSIYTNPDIEFKKEYVKISSNNNSIKFFYGNPDFIKHPKKRLNISNACVQFNLPEETLTLINKTSQILSCDDLKITNKKNGIEISVTDTSNPTSNSSSAVLEGTFEKEFTAYIKMQNLKLIPGSYNVSISSEPAVALFEKISEDVNLTLKYYIPLHVNSQI